MFTPNQYPVSLDAEQRQRLEDLTRNGHAPAKNIQHARILLLSDRQQPGGHCTDPDIAHLLGMHVNTVARIRKQFVLQGQAPALDRKPRQNPPSPAKVDGQVEAHLIALCCVPPPQGHARWTLTLLVQELTRRRFVTSICRETVRKTLKKTNCNLGASSAGASRNATSPALSPRWKTSSTSTSPRTRPTNR